MTLSFDGPAIEDGDQFENWHERIKVTCAHNADKKRFEAHVSWCKASQRDGYAVEQVAIFTDPYVLVAQEPVARFSEKKFDEFCAKAMTACEDIIADAGDATTAAQLLRTARGWQSLVRN